MKTAKRAITGIMATLAMLAVGSAWAGDLTPPGAPGPTMNTLQEIYQKVEHLGPPQTLSDTTTVVQAGSYAGTTLDAVDPDLVASNIRAGVVLFGITGTYTNGGGNGMVLIPAAFSMGDAFDPEGETDELPVHTVSVSAFYMDKTEVTKATWDEVYTWATTNGYSFDNAGSGKATNHPVHTVNWYDCVVWANARSEMDGVTPCYTNANGTIYTNSTVAFSGGCNWSAGGYRLPTEAEWEKAARGGANGRRFPWEDANTIQHARANYHAAGGESYDDSNGVGYHPTYNDGIFPYTSPVGSFAPNGYGLYDMAGNLAEWCWDWYGNTYYASSPGTDPRGPAPGSYRVFRGGYWYSLASRCRVAARDGHSPGYVNYYLGFRLVRAAQ